MTRILTSAKCKYPCWLSIYIYPGNDVDQFIETKLLSFVNDIQHVVTNQANWFYVRYSDRIGPHVRVRFRVSQKLFIEHYISFVRYLFDLRTEVRAHDGDRYQYNPRRRFNINGIGVVRIVNYRPEVNRYGGRRFLGCVEEFFVKSSLCSVGLLCGRKIKYDAIVSCAAVCAFDLFVRALRRGLINLEEVISLRRGWIAHVCQAAKQEPVVFVKLIRDHWHGQRRQWHALFESRRDSLRHISSHTTELWVGAIDNLICEAWQLRVGNGKVPFYSILGSLVHMHNNRLGVKRIDEILILYAICEHVRESRGLAKNSGSVY